MKKFTLGLHIFLYFLLMGLSTVQSYAADVKPADLFGKWKFTSKMEMTEFGKDYADDVFQESEVVIAKDESGYFSFGVTGVAGANTNPQMATFSAEDNTIKITNPNGNNGTWESPNLNFSNTDGVFPWGGVYSNVVWKFDPETQTITMPDFTVVVVSDWDTQKTQIVAKFTECKMELVEKQEIIAEDISGEYHFTEPGGETANDIPAEFDMVLTAENDNNTSYKVTMDFGGDFKVLEFTGCSFDGDLLTIPYDKAYLNDEIFLFTGYIDEPWKSEIEFTTFGDNSLRMQNSLGFGVFDEKGDVPYPGGTILTLQKYWQNGVAVKQIEAADFSGTYVLESANFWPLKDCFDFKANFEMEIEYNEAGGRYYVVKLMGSDIMSLNYGGIPCTANGNELSMDITSSSRYFNFVMDVDFVNVLDADYIYDGDGGMEKNLTLTLFEDGTVTMSDFTIWHKVEGDGEMAAFYSGITGIKKGVDVASVSAKEEAAVYVQNGVIYVKGGNEVALEVYNVDGRKVFDGIAAQVQGLPKGMYIVKCGTAATKILL